MRWAAPRDRRRCCPFTAKDNFGGLLLITRLLHSAIGGGVARLQRCVHTGLPSNDARNSLPHYGSERLELGDTNELNAAVRHLLERWVVRVGRFDRFQYKFSERNGLLVFGTCKSRLSARRNGCPTLVLSNHLDVLF